MQSNPQTTHETAVTKVSTRTHTCNGRSGRYPGVKLIHVTLFLCTSSVSGLNLSHPSLRVQHPPDGLSMLALYHTQLAV